MPNYGAFSANTIQFAREGTAGTTLAAVKVWRGPAADIEDTRVIVSPGADESIGILVPTARDYTAQLGARLAMPETDLSFEQFIHLLEASIKAATPTGAGPYVYAYAPPLTATLNTIKTYTLESGNKIAGDGHEMSYGFVESWTASGRQGEAWKMSANWVGRQKTEAALTPSLALTTVEAALFSKCVLTIDASGGTIGTTAKAGVLLEASITYNSGIQPVMVGDGNLYFAAIKYTRPSVSYSLTLELESGGIANAERAAFEGQAIRLIRLSTAGSDATRLLVFDIAGLHKPMGQYQNSNDNTTIQISGEARYSSADTLYFATALTNNMATAAA